MANTNRVSRMSMADLRDELHDLMSKWLLNELPPAYEPRLQKVLNEVARRDRSEGRRRRSKALWGQPAMFDPQA